MPPVTFKSDRVSTPQTEVRNAPATKKVGGFAELLDGKQVASSKKEFRVTNTGERVVNKASRPRLASSEQIAKDKQQLASLLGGKASTSEIVATALQNHPLLANLPNLKQDLIDKLTANMDPLISSMRARSQKA